VYADETRFWADVTAKSPGNSRAWSNLGYVHALAGRSAAAEQAFLRALESDPGNARAAANLRLLREGRPVGAGEAPAPTGRR
jgi:Flp pilus assembly protein TadD